MWTLTQETVWFLVSWNKMFVTRITNRTGFQQLMEVWLQYHFLLCLIHLVSIIEIIALYKSQMTPKKKKRWCSLTLWLNSCLNLNEKTKILNLSPYFLNCTQILVSLCSKPCVIAGPGEGFRTDLIKCNINSSHILNSNLIIQYNVKKLGRSEYFSQRSNSNGHGRNNELQKRKPKCRNWQWW